MAVRLAVNGNRLHPEFFAGADDAQCNFSAIRYEDLLEHEISFQPPNAFGRAPVLARGGPVRTQNGALPARRLRQQLSLLRPDYK